MGATIFLSTWSMAACFQHSRDWNTATRFLLTHALVDHGTIEISPYVAKEGQLLEHPPTRDLAASNDGRYFCDKAPGLSLLGTIPYALYRWISGNAPALDLTGQEEPSDYWVTLGTVGLAGAISATMTFLLALRWGAGLLSATVVGVGSIGCTYQLVYATLFYGHLVAGMLILLSLFIVVRPNVGSLGMFMAGTLAGWAITVEYTAALFSGWTILIGTISRLGIRRKRSILPIASFGMGHVAPMGALAYYHQQVTGSPFRVPYTLEANDLFAYHREGLGIPIAVPTWEAVSGLLIGPTTGLLWYAFIVVFSIPGLSLLFTRKCTGVALICLTFTSLFCVIAGFPNWHGGLSTGPRLLLPALPLVIVPAALGLCVTRFGYGIEKSCQIVVGVVLTLSLMGITALNSAGGRMPVAVTDPWQQYLLPMIRENRLEGHIGKWLMPTLDASVALCVTIVIVALLAMGPILLAWRCTPHEKNLISPIGTDH
ncbi:hypothetical protein K2Y11_22340 [bacterium]|nr:hypothetical protein [bacterium]